MFTTKYILMAIFGVGLTTAAMGQGFGGNFGGGFGGNFGGNFGAGRPMQDVQAQQAMQGQYLGDLKTQLGVTDEEWNVLQPRIEAVIAAKTELNGGVPPGAIGRGMGMGRQSTGQGEIARLRRELMEMLMNPAMIPSDFASKIQAIREMRKILTVKVNDAESALIELVTPKQEAILIQRGILD
jgi:hypothetical protein